MRLGVVCNKLGIILGALAVTIPTSGHAQDSLNGASGVEPQIEKVSPGGAVSGHVVDGVVGERAGLLALDQWPRFREYVSRQHYVSNHYDQAIIVGEVLPGPAEYYEIPPEFGMRSSLRYAIANDKPVIVDSSTRVLVQVID